MPNQTNHQDYIMNPHHKFKLMAHKRAEISTIRKFGTMAGMWAESHYKRMYLAHLQNLLG